MKRPRWQPGRALAVRLAAWALRGGRHRTPVSLSLMSDAMARAFPWRSERWLARVLVDALDRNQARQLVKGR